MGRRIARKKERAETMTAQNVASHFAGSKALTEKFDTTNLSRIFNSDESGFSIKGMTLGYPSVLFRVVHVET